MIYSIILAFCLSIFSVVSFAGNSIGQIKVEILQTNNAHNTPVKLLMNGFEIGSFSHSMRSDVFIVSENNLNSGTQTSLVSNYGALQAGCEFQYVLYFSIEGSQWIKLGLFKAPTDHVNATIPLGLCNGKLCSKDRLISEQLQKQEDARWEKNKQILKKWLDDTFEKERISFEKSKRRALIKAQITEPKVDISVELPAFDTKGTSLADNDQHASNEINIDSMVEDILLDVELENAKRNMEFLKSCESMSSYGQYLCSRYGGLGWMGAVAESIDYATLAAKGLLTEEEIRQKILSKEAQGRHRLASQVEKQAIVISEIEKRKQVAKYVKHLKDIREMAVNGARFAPGVSDGVDIYEALFGFDAGTGASLDSSQRLFAVLGVLAGSRTLWDSLTSEAKLALLGDKFVIENIESIRQIERFGPIKPGVLHTIELGNGTIADTFRSSSYFEIISDSPITLYRTYESDLSEMGRFWSRTAPTGPLQTTIDLAIDPNWGSNASKWIQIEIPAGTKVYEGIAAEMPLLRGKEKVQTGQLLGGGQQVYIRGKLDHSWIKKRGSF